MRRGGDLMMGGRLSDVKRTRPDRGVIEEFFGRCLRYNAETCAEVGLFRAKDGGRGWIVPCGADSAWGGWFTTGDQLASEVYRCRGVSAYVACNPVAISSRPPEGKNLLRRLRRGEGASDCHIAVVRWLRIDIDPRREEGMRSASTGTELAACLALRDQVIEAEGLASHAMAGMSGNGGMILLRLDDLPNDDRTNCIVRAYLKYIGHHEGEIGAHVDTQASVAAPCRMMPVPGTWKCRGEASTPERPWRMVTLEIKDVTPFDINKWADDRRIVIETPTFLSPAGTVTGSTAPRSSPAPRRPHNAFELARKYMSKVSRAVDGGGGDDHTYDIARRLVWGWLLTDAEALSLFKEWNASNEPKWPDKQLERKISLARNKGSADPGFLLRSERFLPDRFED
jgi:hypothetical protein